MLKIRIASLLLLTVVVAKAQTKYQFTEALAIGPCHHYGREAIINDQLAYQLFTGEWQPPKPGQTLFTDEEGNEVSWTAIEADSSGAFRGRSLADGYLYLSYDAAQAQNALFHVSGNSMFFFNGEPHGGDIYRDGWMYVPVHLKKGLNEILIRCSRWGSWQGMAPRLLFPEKPIAISTEDTTLPHIVLNETSQPLWGAIVIINDTERPLTDLSLTTQLEGKEMTTAVPIIGPMSLRKVGFQFNPAAVNQKNSYTCTLQLKQKGKLLDEKSIILDALQPNEHYSSTFISDIDGSVQYYGVAPQSNPNGDPSALFLSVHGAGVEAIGQARAYQSKDWGVLVAPTNRRPRGFNWEDWGRMDALEVLGIAEQKFHPDPQQIYLTGHSMGGHGTWYLGATYPGKWAAIAPCAAYPTLSSYGSSDGEIPEEGRTDMETLLLRSSNPSNVIELIKNYKAVGIYIHHGDSDRVVPVAHARRMRQLLGEFHNDFSYYEYPGGSHWFGAESVDWPPLFDYFKWHTIANDSTVNTIEFSTANPAISSQYRWAAILQQQHPLQYSRFQLERNKVHKTITGTTENVSILKLSVTDFNIGDTVTITLDDQKPVSHTVQSPTDALYLSQNEGWQTGQKPTPQQKGAHRNGTFKEPFNHHMVFVYSTKGNKDENEWSYHKARFDAEVWYYRANGSVDVLADKNFNPAEYPDQGVILYGNAVTNAAWQILLDNCPIRVQRGMVTVGSTHYTGNDLGAYFVWPRSDSEIASVAVVSGTGLSGMRAAEANQYFAGGSGFPDYMIFSVDMLKNGAKGIKTAGFYGNDWGIEKGDQIE